MNNIETFERLESNVRMYCRDLPLVFDTAQGSRIRGEDGREYLDFFAGAGALNYGHNDPRMRDALIAYLSANGVTHALDLHTTTKRQFLEAIERDLFKPRGWDYKVQFTGPTGADAVEAALKLARKATGRTKVVSFCGAYHGMTAGALAVTGNRTRRGPGLSTDVVFVPYEDSPYGEFDSIGFLERLANDQGSGSELPAAVIVESVQIQAGVYPASNQWLQRLRKWTTDHGVLLICDEIQAGCGRTGDFFGFERSGVVPDLITCAKSIGGFGLPMAIVLLRAGLDVWQPGDHIGTFRGNQLAFLTARIALSYWHDEQFLKLLADNCAAMERAVAGFAEIPGVASARCRGMIAGIDFGRGNVEVAKDAQQRVLQAGVLVDRCGPNGEIIKLMPPLNTPTDQLEDGLRPSANRSRQRWANSCQGHPSACVEAQAGDLLDISQNNNQETSSVREHNDESVEFEVSVIGLGAMGTIMARVAQARQARGDLEPLTRQGRGARRRWRSPVRERRSRAGCKPGHDLRAPGQPGDPRGARDARCDAGAGQPYDRRLRPTPDEGLALQSLVNRAGGHYVKGMIVAYPRNVGRRESHSIHTGDPEAFERHRALLEGLAGHTTFLPGTKHWPSPPCSTRMRLPRWWLSSRPWGLVSTSACRLRRPLGSCSTRRAFRRRCTRGSGPSAGSAGFRRRSGEARCACPGLRPYRRSPARKGAWTPVFDALCQAVQRAAAMGYGDQDIVAVTRLFARECDTASAAGQ